MQKKWKKIKTTDLSKAKITIMCQLAIKRLTVELWNYEMINACSANSNANTNSSGQRSVNTASVGGREMNGRWVANGKWWVALICITLCSWQWRKFPSVLASILGFLSLLLLLCHWRSSNGFGRQRRSVKSCGCIIELLAVKVFVMKYNVLDIFYESFGGL